jgi:hypothetical protein
MVTSRDQFSIQLTFGECCCNGQPLPPDTIAAARRNVLEGFARHLGGAQLYRHTGSYLNAAGTVILEDCTTVLAYGIAAHVLERTLPNITSLAHEVGVLLNQESVLVFVTRMDSTMHWIEPAAMRQSQNGYLSADGWRD